MSDHVLVPLGLRAKGRPHFAMASAKDAERISAHRWRANSCGYAMTVIDGKRVSMHRFLLEAPPGHEVDHRNGNRLDNRRENLRVCSRSENQCNRGKTRGNTSGFKGVGKKGNRWRASIKARKRRHGLGYFATPEDAARAYDQAAIQLHGEFARLNFPVAHLGEG